MPPLAPGEPRRGPEAYFTIALLNFSDSDVLPDHARVLIRKFGCHRRIYPAEWSVYFVAHRGLSRAGRMCRGRHFVHALQLSCTLVR